MKIKHGAKGGTVKETVAKGQWIVLDLGKSISGDLQIVQDGFPGASDGKAQTAHSARLNPPNQEVWGLPVKSFGEGFRVYAQYQREAADILTPAFTERLQALAARCEGKLMFAFVEDKLHVLLDSRRASFEPDSVFNIDEAQIRRKLRAEIQSITQLIDALCLDSDLFVQEG